MTSAKNWPKRTKFSWHGPFKPFTPNTGQTNKFTKDYKFLSIKSQTVNKTMEEFCLRGFSIWMVRAQKDQNHFLVSFYTAISRKVVGRSARDNPERYCGWFWVHSSLKKFERMAPEPMDVCLRALKECNKSRFDNYSIRNSVLIISHITFRDCRVHIFSDNLSRNGCIQI